MSTFHQNEWPIEWHDLALASIRVHILDLCLRTTLCLCSMFYLLCQLPSCSLGASPSYTQVALLLVLYWVDSGPYPHHSTSQPFIESDLHIDSKCTFILCYLGSLPHLISQCIPLMHYLKQDHAMTPRPLLSPLSFMKSFWGTLPQHVWSVTYGSPSRESRLIPPRYLSHWSNFFLCFLLSESFGDHYPLRLLYLAKQTVHYSSSRKRTC